MDDYFLPGQRKPRFLGCKVVKQHRILTQILMGLLNCGFTLRVVDEVQPSEEMLDIPGMKDEMQAYQSLTRYRQRIALERLPQDNTLIL